MRESKLKLKRKRLVKPISYEPLSVRESLTRMKNISELMIDLAYSSVIFNNEELAEEVFTLEEEIDNLVYLTIMNISLAIRDKDDAEQLLGLYGLCIGTDEVSNAAADIASIVRMDVPPHPLIKMINEAAEERIEKYSISPKSCVCDKKLSELEFESNLGVHILAIKRNGKWTFDPSGSTELKANDIVLAIGADLGLKQFEKIVRGESTNIDIVLPKKSKVEDIELTEEGKILLKMKEISEFMVYLAYSSLALSDFSIAEEVLFLENYVDSLLTKFQIQILEKPYGATAEQAIGLLRVASASENIADAAVRIASLVESLSTKTHPVINLIASETEEVVLKVTLSPESILVDKPLSKLKLKDTVGMTILSVRRSDEWIHRPPENFVLRDGDVLLLYGYKDSIERMKRLADGSEKEL